MSLSPQAHLQRATWLRTLYLARAAFSIAWVGLAFTAARQSALLAAVLLVVYPAWDAAANLLDARMTGGAAANRSQVLNAWTSGGVALAALAALPLAPALVLPIFAAWAILSGLMQLATALRRRRDTRGQWVMMVSGAQSALAGVFFLTQRDNPKPVIETIAGYAAVGALYFLISGVVLLLRRGDARRVASVDA